MSGFGDAGLRGEAVDGGGRGAVDGGGAGCASLAARWMLLRNGDTWS